MLNSNLKMAGILTTVIHGVSQKNGLGYARVTMQDYTGSFEMGVYNEEYKRYKDLLTDGQVVYVEGIFKKGYGNSDRSYFRIQDIRLLASVSEDLTKSLTVRVPLENINPKFIHQIKKVFENYNGKHNIHMRVFDLEDELSVDFSSSIKIDVSSKLIKELSELGLSYKLN